MLQNSTKPRQVQRTCSWIIEATLLLIDEKPYDKITVSDIVQKAGIARQTFYRNYKDKDEVVVEYFSNIFMSELLSVENVDKNEKHDIILSFNIKYMIKNQVNLVKMLSIIGIENLFVENFNNWLDLLSKQNKVKLDKEQHLIYRYKIYYQVIGIIMVIMDWFKNDMPVSVEKMLQLLSVFTIDTKNTYTNIPNIQLQFNLD
jgi:AcrR family transcriptional regulator